METDVEGVAVDLYWVPLGAGAGGAVEKGIPHVIHLP